MAQQVEEKTPERKEIEARLKDRPWFANTSTELQDCLIGLPENCNGFLQHLAGRPLEGGGVRLVRLRDLLFPQNQMIFGFFVNFEVEKLDDPQKHFNYQYFIWKQGPMSGTKGVVLVEDAEEITHVVCLKGFSFAVGDTTFDCPGGFGTGDKATIKEQFLVELQEELGLPEMKVERIIQLGFNLVDRGLTSNCPAMIAAVISGENARSIKAGKYVNVDPYEMESGAVVVPVGKLWGPDGFMMKNNDGFFLGCLARLIALGEIQVPN